MQVDRSCSKAVLITDKTALTAHPAEHDANAAKMVNAMRGQCQAVLELKMNAWSTAHAPTRAHMCKKKTKKSKK